MEPNGQQQIPTFNNAARLIQLWEVRPTNFPKITEGNVLPEYANFTKSSRKRERLFEVWVIEMNNTANNEEVQAWLRLFLCGCRQSSLGLGVA